jgi:hypothetical protein
MRFQNSIVESRTRSSFSLYGLNLEVVRVYLDLFLIFRLKCKFLVQYLVTKQHGIGETASHKRN